jgi:glycosyltransferase involved in cell wall biosynthesis
MKIGIISKRFPPEHCGVGDFTFHLAHSQAARGHDVVVFTSTRGAAAETQQAPPGYVRTSHARLDGWGDIAQILALLHLERITQVQIEYSGYAWGRWGFAFWVNALALALRLGGIRVTVAFHELYIHFGLSPVHWVISILQRLHVELLAWQADEIIVNTPQRARRMRGIPPWRASRIHYRPNASNIAVSPASAAAREALRSELGVPPGATVVATFGNFAAAKNYEAVIHALAQLPKPVEARLWLLGDFTAASPAYLERLHNAIRALGLQGRVHWSGPLTAAGISARLSAADIFVLPQPDGDLTRSGAFMAAAAHGLPVIAVRNAENQQDFAHGENVWLVPASRGELLAPAVATLAAGEELRRRLAGNLRSLYERKFDWPMMTTPHRDATEAPALAESSERSY